MQYIYDGDQAVGEVRSGNLSHSLMTGLFIDEHLARTTIVTNGQASSQAILTDALGSALALAKATTDNTNGQIDTTYSYSPYGQTTQQGTSDNPSQYTGRENDGAGAAGLYYYRARYYDPVLKRFISEDPIRLNGGLNVYAYVEGDPISFVDPDGEIPVAPIIVGYARCIAKCMAEQAITDAITGDLDCFDPWSTGKDCALECLNPFNWLKGPKKLDATNFPPSKYPKRFDPVKGTKGKRDKETGEIWEKDQLHKDHWEVYKNKKDYEKGKRDRDVWDDGRPKRNF